MCCVVVAHARLRYARRYRQCLHMLGGLATRGGMQDASEEGVAISGGGEGGGANLGPRIEGQKKGDGSMRSP